MSKQSKKVTINIDNQVLEVERGLTILQAAEQNNIYIPTLCAHKDLTPFGGCRMCIVEVEGMRGLPTACTTPVVEGMVIRTHTAQVQAERKEILQLILSEHTSSCLICEEKDECKDYMGTIRKAGVITGCRFCPNDGQCELQEVVEKLGIKEISYPIYYRHLPVEKDDPFYDRDYNLCILCGRCIRMCQEIRAANTLAFKQRGRYTVIGPAYSRTHFEAGCEFCGACVSVCPTGALSEKVRKWEGKAEREEITTCPLCGVGCQMRLQVKGGRIIGSLPAEDPLVNNGQLCVKGRFCVTELVGNYQRLRRPYKTQNDTKVAISWDEAIQLAAEKLSTCSGEDFGMLISPNCCNEDLYLAQKFARIAVGSHNIDTTARPFYGSGFNAYLDLMRMCVPLSELRDASVILCVGLDARFGRSVVGVELRKAISRGAKIISINPRHHSLSVIADKWIQPVPGTEVSLFRSLVKLTEKKKTGTTPPKSKGKSGSLGDELATVAKMLKGASAPMILVGSEFLQYDQSPQILEAIEKLARNVGAGILPLPAYNNLFGSILMGAYPELLPGGFSSANKKRIDDLRKKWNADVPHLPSRLNRKILSSGRKLKVLYLIGKVPPNLRPPCDFLISQNIYPPDPWHEADLVLPAAAFTEVDGTFINGEGRIQRVRKAVNPPGEALPDWEILCQIAQKMEKKGFNFSNVREIHEDISSLVKGFGDFDGTKRKAGPLICEGRLTIPQTKSKGTKKADKRFPLLLNTSVVEHTYRGFPLTTWVEGARKLFAEGIVDINSEDARKAKISEGDEVVVTSAHFEKIWPARISSEQSQGTLHITLRQGESVGPNPHPVRIRKKDV
ncbi:MAG: molybdopterin-dependent oxidoreductase [candidate division Zixibacteria bacterium]|nr:molybdopterin-dependent oxidoreductase [candidate division Zixibacteria bacterium]